MKTLTSILVLCASLAAAQAQLLITSITGGNDLSVGPGTAGFAYTAPSVSETVYALGVLATDTTLNNSHQVGIWDTTPQHNLIASVTVTPNNSFEIGNTWFVNLASPITLTANTTYRLGASYIDNDFDLAKGNVTSISVSAGTVGDAYLSTGTTFTFPDLDVSGANKGFFGPNASFAPVPEPAQTMVVVAGLLLGVAAWRRVRAA